MLRRWFFATATILILSFLTPAPTAASGSSNGTASPPFPDLAGHWAAPAVATLLERGVVQGYPDGSFRPQAPADRLTAVVILARALSLPLAGELPPFADAAAIPSWARPAVAAARPLVDGVPGQDGRLYFRPYDQLNRLQLAVFASRALTLSREGQEAEPELLHRYRDAAAVPKWGQAALAQALAASLIQGEPGGYLRPQRVATRAELAAVTERLLARLGGGTKAPSRRPPATTPPTGKKPSPSRGPYVVGFYDRSGAGDRRALNSLRDNPGIVTMVADVGFPVDRQGRVHGQPDRELLSVARAQGIPVVAVITNDPGSGFDRSLVHHLLNSPEAARAAVSAIVDFCLEHGLAGINLDFENVPPQDRAALTAFVAQLGAAMRGHGLMLTMSVPAKVWDDPLHAWSGAYDYSALAEHVDALIPMGYDEHWFGGPAGPVASLPWIEAVATFAMKAASKTMVILALPAYGYDWAPALGQARAFPGREGLALAARFGATVAWDDRAQVPHFTYYRNGVAHVVYYENAHSLRAKLRAVAARGLDGIALWRLGYEDPAVWPLLERYRSGRLLDG